MDHAGIDLPAGLPIDLETLRNAEAIVVREHIGLSNEPVDDLFALRGLQVDLQAFLASVGPCVGHGLCRGAPPLVQAPIGGVDLDDPRPKIGQKGGAVGPGLDGRHVQDGHS
jgi:hypothetical protein